MRLVLLLVLSVSVLACVLWCHCATEAETATPEGLPRAEGFNVIVIVIDALRADHLGCYGYERKTSPFMDSLAAEGIVFERALSHSSFTCESVATLLTGVLPSGSPTGAGWFARPNPRTANMAELFARAGYACGLFTDTPALELGAFGKGFCEAKRVPTDWGRSGLAPQVTELALEFVKKNAGKRVMMYLHYLDPHAPYEPSDQAYLRFADKVYPNPLALFSEVRPNITGLIEDGFGPGDPRFEDMVLRYDAEISEVDGAVKALLQGLGELGALEDTLVVVTADHGQEFLDHGFVEHAWTLYDESIHVPLIFWRPGLFAPGRIAERVSHADMLPTLLDLAAIACDRQGFSGTPLFVREGEQWTFTPPHKPVISELLLETRNLMHAVILDDQKYVAAQKWMAPGECAQAAKKQHELIKQLRAGTLERPNIWGAVEREEFYDLSSDPEEKRNIIGKPPEKYDSLKRILAAYEASCPEQLPLSSSERSRPELSDELEEQMEGIGYLK